LIPQLENSIRYVLRQRNVIVSGLDAASGIEEDYDLNRLLYMPELQDILGEDTVFNLRLMIRAKRETERVGHELNENTDRVVNRARLRYGVGQVINRT
jgi:hypothetical protein